MGGRNSSAHRCRLISRGCPCALDGTRDTPCWYYGEGETHLAIGSVLPAIRGWLVERAAGVRGDRVWNEPVCWAQLKPQPVPARRRGLTCGVTGRWLHRPMVVRRPAGVLALPPSGEMRKGVSHADTSYGLPPAHAIRPPCTGSKPYQRMSVPFWQDRLPRFRRRGLKQRTGRGARRWARSRTRGSISTKRCDATWTCSS